MSECLSQSHWKWDLLEISHKVIAEQNSGWGEFIRWKPQPDKDVWPPESLRRSSGYENPIMFAAGVAEKVVIAGINTHGSANFEQLWYY